MKKLACLLIIGSFISCTSSDSVESIPDVTMTGYKIESWAQENEYRSVTTGHLFNNKMFSETFELFHNGVVEMQETQQKYFYNADGTLNHYKRDIDGLTNNLYYDSNQNLIGAKLFREGTEGELNFRFIHHSENVVYFERIDLPYDNPNATPSIRYIINLNNNNDVVSAGVDHNFDGVMENVNTFEYANDNLTAIHYYNGVNESYQYSAIVDNFKVLMLNSFGKKNLNVLGAECFAYLNQYQNVNLSKNILQSVSAEAVYQVLPSNFFEFKTLVDGEGRTTTTQFFFN